jgi:hypothetical protein
MSSEWDIKKSMKLHFVRAYKACRLDLSLLGNCIIIANVPDSGWLVAV